MVWDDTRSEDPYLAKQEKLWSSQLGRLIHKIARRDLVGPGKLLNLFEQVAERFNDKGEPLVWNSPVTNFPVVQNYRKATTKRTWVRYDGQKINISLEDWNDDQLDPSGQRQGTSPNVVHSVDAVHLVMTVDACPFSVAVVHDSFGCTPGSMSYLFRAVRETFVQLYEQNPLDSILVQLGCEDLVPEKGNLEVTQILESDYAFC